MYFVAGNTSFKFHWGLSLWAQSTKRLHWSELWLGADEPVPRRVSERHVLSVAQAISPFFVIHLSWRKGKKSFYCIQLLTCFIGKTPLQLKRNIVNLSAVLFIHIHKHRSCICKSSIPSEAKNESWHIFCQYIFRISPCYWYILHPYTLICKYLYPGAYLFIKLMFNTELVMYALIHAT